MREENRVIEENETGLVYEFDLMGIGRHRDGKVITEESVQSIIDAFGSNGPINIFNSSFGGDSNLQCSQIIGTVLGLDISGDKKHLRVRGRGVIFGSPVKDISRLQVSMDHCVAGKILDSEILTDHDGSRSQIIKKFSIESVGVFPAGSRVDTEDDLPAYRDGVARTFRPRVSMKEARAVQYWPGLDIDGVKDGRIYLGYGSATHLSPGDWILTNSSTGTHVIFSREDFHKTFILDETEKE